MFHPFLLLIYLLVGVGGHQHDMFDDYDDEDLDGGVFIVGDVFGIYDYFSTPGNAELQEQLNHVQEQLDVIESLITELVATVEEESIKTQYVSSQRVIMESLRCYNNYENMTNPMDAAYWYKEFLKWGSFVRESVNFLMDGMLGTGFIASDILNSIEIISQVTFHTPY